MELGESESLEGEDHAGDAGDALGTVDENSVGVEDVDDGAELVGEGTVVDDADAADLNVFLLL